VERLAESLQVSALDTDEFVQGIENPDHDFLIGVQWHPEYLPYMWEQRALFRAFAESVRTSEVSIGI
jgi:putative glutamine amidotransferase